MDHSTLGDVQSTVVGRSIDAAPLLRFGNIQPTQEAFDQIFTVFLALGTAVGIVVSLYMFWKAWKYRAGSDVPDEKRADPPELGELPGKGEGGKKLFLSFGLSAIIVLSLIFWTYGTLLLMNDSPDAPEDQKIDVTVEGFRFGWTFIYPNGHESTGELRVPNDTVVDLDVTSTDVMHNLGLIPFERKTDAIPGSTTEMWFLPQETATYENGAVCYELCGAGHSQMTADIVVMEQSAFDEWYESTGDGGSGDGEASNDAGNTTTEAGVAANATSTDGQGPTNTTSTDGRDVSNTTSGQGATNASATDDTTSGMANEGDTTNATAERTNTGDN